MPRTFAGAVSAMRGLGFRYLWINSLCVLQDSVVDWEIESSKMGDYYWNAPFTIAAAASTDSSQGLFRERDRAELYPCVTSLNCCDPRNKATAPKLVHISARIAQAKSGRIVQAGGRITHGRNALDTRAWTLQEQILSSKLIIFEPLKVSFICLEMVVSEDRP